MSCHRFEKTNALPFVSVILPIRNEAAFIKSSLQAVLAQDYPLDHMEVFVVDGMSSDGTVDIVRQVFEESDSRREKVLGCSDYPRLEILKNPGRIVPSSMNKAIARARGEIIVRVDGHALIEGDYISQCVRALERTGADVVGGLMTPVGKGFIGETISLAHNLRFGLGGGLFHRATQEIEADTVYMGTFRRDLFSRVGLFNESLARNQDIELNARVWQSGGRVILSPEIRSKYFCPNTIKGLWRKNYANGAWLWPTIAATPNTLSIRHFIPLLFVLALALGSIISLTVPFGWLLLLMILGSYIGSLAIATLSAAARNRWSFLISLPIVFIVLHVSYGVGSLIGLPKFLIGRFVGSRRP
jgi:glycosyltransferase involved in cell wall biosynthesis